MLHFFLRYESPIPPNVEIMQYSIAEAIPMAVVGFAVAFSVAKVYADKHDYVIDGSQVRDRVTFVCKSNVYISYLWKCNNVMGIAEYDFELSDNAFVFMRLKFQSLSQS